MSKLSKALIAAAGNSGGAGLTVEDVFSTYLYSGTSATHNITNNVNLADEGGLVWIKGRSGVFSATNHRLFDTERGVYKHLATNLTSSEGTHTNTLTAFNTDGFTLGTDASLGEVNYTGMNYASWTFRKAEKFFDVVTYTGNGVAGREIAHNLGSVPACIIVKRTDSAFPWIVYHTSIGNDKILQLDDTAATQPYDNWYNTDPTSSVFTINSYGSMNASGGTYVAYLFASDAGGFGDDGSESIIKCGSYTGNGSYLSVDCGFEAQWVLIKRTDSTGSWIITDALRGMTAKDVDGKYLYPNLSNAEATTIYAPNAEATGFSVGNSSGGGAFSTSGADYIYIAIRRPMKTPESGTEVFNSLAYTGDGASTRDFDLGMTVDAYFQACRSSSTYDFKNLTARLTAKGLHTAGTGTEFTTNTSLDVQDGLRAIGFENTLNQSGETYIINGFKRATGFFDVVAYSAVGSSLTTNHNLGVAPEAVIVKKRSGSSNWTWSSNFGGTLVQMELNLNSASSPTDGYINSVTSSTFTTGGSGAVISTGDYIAYLFATLAGVSKVGSYTGTGSNVDVDCGFSAGARFILIKRTDSTGDWYVWDSERGIVAGNDPYLLLNSTAAEVTSTDYIDPLSSGFTVTSSAPAALNASGGSYIFLAIS